MKMKTIFCSMAIAFLVFCCTIVTPKPVASFNYNELDGTPSTGYGTVRFADGSNNAESYKWDFGNGLSSSEKDPTTIYKTNGTYSVTLRVTNKGGESSLTKTIVVAKIPTTGSFVFQTTVSKEISIYIEGKYIGKTTKYYATVPTVANCGVDGNVTTVQNGGTYNYTAQTGELLLPTKWSGTITVVNGQCSGITLK